MSLRELRSASQPSLVYFARLQLSFGWINQSLSFLSTRQGCSAETHLSCRLRSSR